MTDSATAPDSTLLALIADQTHSAVVTADAGGRVRWVNPAFTRITGYALDEAHGRPLGELFQGTDPATGTFVRDRIAAAEGFRAEVLGRRKDGGAYWLDIDVRPVTGAAGAVTHFIAIGPDVTARKGAEAARAHALEEQEIGAERARGELAQRLAEQSAALEEQRQLATLRAELGLALTRNAPLAELLRGCCDAVLRHTGAALVRVWTLGDADTVLVLQAGAGLCDRTDGPHARVPVGRSEVGRVAGTRAPHLTNEALEPPGPDLTAFAGHPLLCEGHLVGVLALYARAPLARGVPEAIRAAADAVAAGVARKRAEDRVAAAQQRHRATVESALDCIVTVDARGRITELNAAAERTLGYTRGEVLGRELAGVMIPAEHRAEHRAGMDRYLRTGASKILGTRLAGLRALRKDGSRFPVELSIVPIRTDDGVGFTAFFRDVTAEQAAEAQRREAEQQLQRAKDEAEAAVRMQSRFLANMSHELRTPVAAIVGFAEMLLDPRLGPGPRGHALQVLIRSGKHLAALVNDVLDLGKIEAGRMEIERTRCQLRRVVCEAVAQAEVAAREKGVELLLAPVGRVPEALTTDPTRLRQILDNLLSNAIKFTGGGRRVELRVRMDAPPGAGRRLLLEVEDEGIGIPPEGMTRLFKPFTQADASTTRKFGGTGLGLNICKRLARLLGGDITVRSAPGTGSCFALVLPVPDEDARELIGADAFGPAAQSSTSSKAPVPQLAGRVLLAEDTPAVQVVLRYFLERAGLTVEAVENGRAAVERALDEEFDVILMDVQMPEMDGYAATSTLRQSGYTRSVVALTAHAMAGDEEKCLRAGCNAYLTKPVDPAKLIQVVASQLESRSWEGKLDAARRGPEPTRPPRAAGTTTLDELTANYRQALPGKIRAVVEAFRTRDVPQVAELAHKLRGSAGMYGLPGVSAAAGVLEDGCRAGGDAARLTGLVDELVIAAAVRS